MSSIREICTLPISPSMIEILAKNGFLHVSDLENMKPFDLSKELNTSIEMANAILETLAPSFTSSRVPTSIKQGGTAAMTAKDVSIKAQSLKPIITFCKSIDQMLGGGIPMGQITEICGLPGIGKTQLATQIALDVQIPKLFSGNEGETIYIDSEGSFMAERAMMMADALSDHLKRLSHAKVNPNVGESEEKLRDRLREKIVCANVCNRDHFLDGIHVFRVHEQSEQVATINQLPAFLALKPNVKLIIIDSVAFHFRQDLRDSHTRLRMLGQLSQQLNEIAYKNNLAVVVINHVTNNFGRAGETTRSAVVPALGEQWAHCITNRVVLSWEDKANGIRRATLTKCPTRANAAVNFRISNFGIRDCGKANGTDNQPPPKRVATEIAGNTAKHIRTNQA